MATVLDFGLLREFSAVFAWLLVFVVLYGILQVVDIFKSRGINALIAVAMTILLFTTGGTTDVIRGLMPWFVISAFFVLFLFVLSNFVGIPTDQVVGVFAGKGAVWWFFTTLAIGLVISLVASGQFSRSGETQIDPETGEEVRTTGGAVISVITDPKVLGFILIMSISAITVALMAGVAHVQ